MINFNITHKAAGARVGKLKLKHGVIDTPSFMTIGTYGSVKSLTNKELIDSGVQIILCNAYHLMLRPDKSIIKKAKRFHHSRDHCRMGKKSNAVTRQG